MKVRFFNFSHDLALARNCNNYTPPRNVQAMERDLDSLSKLIPQGEISYNPHAPVWGWNRSLVYSLKVAGYKNLPDDDQLQKIRQLSSRKTAVLILRRLIIENKDLPFVGESFFCEDETSFDSFFNRGENLIMKEPLSGSGRGLRFVHNQPTEVQRNWAQRCIRQQGGVVVEPYYHKIQDFALEYLSTENGIVFSGLSVFQTNSNNVYSGNIIDTQEHLWQYLYKYFQSSIFQKIIFAQIQELNRVFHGHYLGPLGVDMMVIRHHDKLAIHPCVEINVRRTMGELSLHLLPHLSPGKKALFSLHFEKTPEALCHTLSKLPQPTLDLNSRLTSGIQQLTPVHNDTQYTALLQIL